MAAAAALHAYQGSHLTVAAIVVLALDLFEECLGAFAVVFGLEQVGLTETFVSD